MYSHQYEVKEEFKMKLEGVFAAMMTPFGKDMELNLSVICDMVEFFIEKGLSGIFPISNVGEQIQLTDAQKQLFIQTVVKQARGRVPIFPGISSAGTQQSVTMGRFCREAGADGVVLSAPYYFKYPQPVVLGGLQAVARQVDLPVVLYNIPMFANPISLDSLNKLMEIPNIIGIKDSSGSIPELLELLRMAKAKRPDFSVMIGWEEMLYSAMGVGADGCMTASGGVFPEIMSDLYRSMRRGDTLRALELEHIISRATSAMKSTYFPYGYKIAMEARGFRMGASPVTFDESVYDKEKTEITMVVYSALEEYKQMC